MRLVGARRGVIVIPCLMMRDRLPGWTSTGGYVRDASADKVLRDLSAVVADIDELFAAGPGNANAAIGAARARMAENLKQAKAAMAKGRRSVLDEAREAAKSADRYAQEHVWQVIGVAGCVGLLVGVLLGLSQSPRPRRD